MSVVSTTETARVFLRKAHLASQSGNDVFVHVEGIAPLQVREVELLEDDSTFATIHCWPNEESKGEIWVVPLGSVRAVQIQDWHS